MMGAPEATQVQLSPLPTSAMSDWYNKTRCAGLCFQERLGGLGWRKINKPNHFHIQLAFKNKIVIQCLNKVQYSYMLELAHQTTTNFIVFWGDCICQIAQSSADW